MRTAQKEVAEIRDICGKLDRQNLQYVLAVANALKFSQDHAQQNRRESQVESS